MSKRIDKFKKKLDGAIRGKLFDDQKEFMIANETKPTKDLVKIEIEVKEICDQAPPLLQYYYIIFGKECYSKTLTHAGGVLTDEIAILENKWFMRGLDHAYLDLIKEIFIKINPFIMDVSLLDSNDRLT